jgi:hypothetical protein
VNRCCVASSFLIAFSAGFIALTSLSPGSLSYLAGAPCESTQTPW